MPRSSKNGGAFQVHCSGAIAIGFKRIQKRAKAEGRGEQVLAAIRRIWQRLAYHPDDLGEEFIGYQLCVCKSAPP